MFYNANSRKQCFNFKIWNCFFVSNFCKWHRFVTIISQIVKICWSKMLCKVCLCLALPETKIMKIPLASVAWFLLRMPSKLVGKISYKAFVAALLHQEFQPLITVHGRIIPRVPTRHDCETCARGELALALRFLFEWCSKQNRRLSPRKTSTAWSRCCRATKNEVSAPPGAWGKESSLEKKEERPNHQVPTLMPRCACHFTT